MTLPQSTQTTTSLCGGPSKRVPRATDSTVRAVADPGRTPLLPQRYPSWARWEFAHPDLVVAPQVGFPLGGGRLGLGGGLPGVRRILERSPAFLRLLVAVDDIFIAKDAVAAAAEFKATRDLPGSFMPRRR